MLATVNDYVEVNQRKHQTPVRNFSKLEIM